MDRNFEEFIEGLRRYIKHQSIGKFNGKDLAVNWHELNEQQQDALISDAFVRNASEIATVYHAIHTKGRKR